MKTLVLFCSFLFTNMALAENFETMISNGNYAKAIEVLNSDQSVPDSSYYLGLSHARLQEFDKAITYFEKSIESKSEKKDLYYEYGQALYAANDLKKSRNAFKTSAENKFNIPASLYYIGHISQILEEYKVAFESYNKLIKNYPDEIKLKQISQFQLAETILMLMKDKNASNIDKHILPLLKKAQAIDPTSSVANDIDKRYKELLIEYKLDPDLLDNGRRISSKRWNASIGQKLKFDDNVTLSNFDNNITQTKKESFLFESEAFYQHTFLLKKKFIIQPLVRFTFIQYGDQTSSDVFQNDSYIVNLGLKNKYEHSFFNRPASLILDLDYSKTAKDSSKIHKRDPYSNSYSLTLGESFSYFDRGDTTFKLKRKEYQGTNSAINSFTYEFSADQTIAFSNQNLLILMMNYSTADNYNNTTMNTDTSMLRFDYIIPEIFSHHTLTFATAVTSTDTLSQTATRGTETTINPSLDLSRELNKNAKLSVNYDFTNNNSKSTDYKYQKSVVTVEFKYVF